jgi:CotH kinase protein
MGLMAPRTGYAKVSVNGTDYGLYVNLETYDDVSLDGLPSTQHLYEGEVGDDVDGTAGDFEIDEGSELTTSDLDALIAAVTGDDPADFSDRVASYADLQQMVRMWAVERYIGDWDGYTGLNSPWSPNNYYLHSDDVGLFTMLPSGADISWVGNLDFGFTGGGIMFDKCLADPSCLELYRQALRETRDLIAGLHLDDLATSTAAFLAPYEDDSSREEHSPEQIAEGVSEVVDYIHSRPADAAAWLGETPADPPADPGTSGAVEGATSPNPPAKKKKCKRAKKSAAKSGKCRKRKNRD